MTRDPQQDLDDELGFHMEQRIKDYIARGMSPEEARAAAAQRFGDHERVRTTCVSIVAADRASEERRVRLHISWLDVKLGLRMFVRYPGLSLVSVIGMAVAIAIGAAYYNFIGAVMDPAMPFPGGDRVVSISHQAVPGLEAGNGGQTTALDFTQWRGQLQSIGELGAFRDSERNLITADGAVDLVRVAAVTAAGFRSTQVEPVLGRTLMDGDEHPGAAPVLIIGHDDWQRRFGSDPQILGRSVRLDDTVHTIVGVMPPGFAFPIKHRAWVPLRLATDASSPVRTDPLHIFGRLAEGRSLAEARAEMSAVGERMAAAFPQTHAGVRPQVNFFTRAFMNVEGPEAELMMRGFQLSVGLLLLIVAINVAILVYSRTATRMGEIAVRTALGASRGRVVSQLFVEAAVLSSAAAVIGITIAHYAFAVMRDALARSPHLPYWLDLQLSAGMMAYAAALALLAALVIGVLPALKATGKRVQSGLQQFSVRGAGMQLGRTWTALVVLQVAIAVAVLPAALSQGEESLRVAARQPAAAASSLLRGRLTLGDESGDLKARFTNRVTVLKQRLEAEPGVTAVTFSQRFPGEENATLIEIDGATARVRARPNRVGPDLFKTFDVPLLAGRGFTTLDTGPNARAVIVDQLFADLLGAGPLVGRRIRFAAERGAEPENPWLEIVGVVPAFSETFSPINSFSGAGPRLYVAGAPGDDYAPVLSIRFKGSASDFARKVTEVVASVDPQLRLADLDTAVTIWNEEVLAFKLIASGIIAVMASVLLLSAAGIYAMMSFTVTRRRREIGIRAALGADTRRILAGIFGRAATQLGAGVTIGLAIAVALDWSDADFVSGGNLAVLVPTVIAVMFTVGLLAAIGPARRGLAVQPTEALRDE